ncbi:Protein of unknown function (DUF3055) [Schinkia azotoformans MEV2011]|uniref:Protein dltD n=1 Tax=Schinkia azotoformans MEV2011 TaxID=1348973 RepID=A0A072NHB4_SCHAZ|nr:SAV0927 family protein [Schinkia azotoformans]KEF36303.1 Protein of unknown function (DUF3055) [Schinkia azotoformans MEV2011]MEC1697886.1 DUF3055 family protein [Schinkia azotoformans]MEC1717289.1 DUF3055 family protein [Schinkia azotoformans]MEC1723165.1 DUF3055 family protein [Schinkia azotoformans]MEC1739331.1 DUF3055 family protein [Schinkia azotoformans]
MIDILLEEKETYPVHYYCVAGNSNRYDLTVVFSNQFFNKSMVISIQTGKMVLMCQDDIEHESSWAGPLGIHNIDLPEIKTFFGMLLNQRQFSTQY